MLGMVASVLNATEVTIGAGDQTARVPVDMYWKNSLFECMYFQDELGFVSGTISGVKFYNNFVTDLQNMPTNIWLGTTTQTSFATDGWIPSGQLTQVFNGTINYPAGANTIDVTLTTPFNYTGGTLVMMVERVMDTQYYSSSDYFQCQTIGTNRALKLYSDSTDFDPAAPATGASLTGQFPKTTFVYTGQAINNDLACLSVTGNVTPSAQSSWNYVISVKNNGSVAQSTYSVKLMKEGDVEIGSVAGTAIQPQATSTFTIPWTPTATGPTYLYGKVVLTGDEIPQNNNSPHLPVVVQQPGIVAITVGNGGATGRMPVDMFYHNSLFETIFLSSELNIGGLMTGIQFYNNFVTDLPNMPTNIWVGETTQGDLSAGWIPSTQLTQVFNGTVNYPTGANNINITFTTPYPYGGGNLVVMVERPMDTVYYSSSDLFVTQAGTLASRTLNVYSDTTDYDPAAPPTDTAEANFPRTTMFFVTTGMGALQGTVTAGGNPVAGATVSVANSTLTTTTATNGSYTFPFIGAGAHAVTATKHGYTSVTANVTIVENQTTTQNFTIATLPQVTVTGRIVGSDQPTVGLSGATITFSGYEPYTATTNASGQFTINNVYSSQTYQYLVHMAGYADTSGQAVVGTTNLNMGDVIVNEVAYPANSVVATEAANHSNVVLTWNEPGTGVAAWIHYDSGENDDSIGTGAAADFDVAIRYPASALQDYVGTSLQAVKVWPAQAGTFSLRVWTGGTPAAPGNMVVDQAFTPVLDTYNTVLLTTPVPVTGNEELWFGYRCNVTGGYPAGCDAGPATDGFGNMMYYQGAWTTLLALAPTLNYNWNIQGYVGYGAPTAMAPLAPLAFNADRVNRGTLAATGVKKNITPSFSESNPPERVRVGYKVWRFLAANQANEASWTLLTPSTITPLTYTDNAWQPLAPGVYKYAVKAVYTNNVLSNPAFSNALDKDMMGTLAGTVTDFGTGTPIQGAVVTAGTYTGTTNAQGQYSFAVYGGTYTVSCAKVGYQAWSQPNVVVTGLQTTTVNIQMIEIAFPPYHVVSTEAANFSNVVTTWNAPDPNAEPVETFETGDFTAFPWVMGGDQPWIISADAHGGTHSAVSGDINDNQSSTIQVTRNVLIAGNISFWYKVSSESNYDWLTFYIDDVEAGSWSGTVDWTQATYPLATGTHVLKWEYSKDVSLSSGSDCGWIDDISFPASTNPTRGAEKSANIFASQDENSRALVGYKVWRLLASDQGNEANWTLLTPTSITALTYTDNAWQPLPSGVYKFAVKAIYTNNVLSQPAFGNEIHKGMMGMLTGTVTDFGTTTPIEGATITAGTYTGTSNAQGVYSFAVYQGSYTVTATKTGYQPFSQANVNVTGLQTTTLNIAMVELAFPPNTVVATEAANFSNVALTWNEPGTGTEAWIHYDSGENDDSIGTGATADFDVAIRFPASALQDYVGTSLQAVKVWPAQAGTFSVRVWTGGTPAAPGNMVVDQAFTPVLDTYNTVVLSTPVPVNGTEELWFGYRCNVTGGYPAGCDAGPATDGFGNMMYYQGAWSTLLALAPTLNYNWNIQGFVGFAAPTQLAKLTPLPFNADRFNTGTLAATGEKRATGLALKAETKDNQRVRLGYKVWRLLSANQGNEATWTLLTPTTITATAYTDNAWQPLPSGVYKFAVKAIYTNNVMSVAAFSNEIHKGMMGVLTGTVTEFGTNVPIQGVTVTAGTYTGTTNAQGVYSFPVYQGTYSVSAVKGGYQPNIQNGVVVTGLQTTTLNFVLTEITLPPSAINAVLAGNNVNITWSAPDPNSATGEDFESGDFSALPWTMGGDSPWLISTTDYHHGTHSAVSGDINDNQSSTIEVNRNILIAGNISFWYKVSSESNYDFLTFYVDGTEVGSWSGTVDWTQGTYPLTTGTHNLKWEYSKDVSVSSGSDCAWIDEITFPVSVNPTSLAKAMPNTEVFGTVNQASDRSLTGYKVWRLIQGQETNEAAWTTLTPNPITATAFQDTGWTSLPDGTYLWGIKAVYTGGALSQAAFSNTVPRITQIGTIAGIVRNQQNQPINGATITCGTTTATSNAQGAYSMTIQAGTHSVTASHPNYAPSTQNGVVVVTGQTTTVNFQLAPTTDLLNDSFESYADFATTFAPWTCVDVDGGNAYNMTGTTWPGTGTPQAFMVFNPASTTPPITTFTARTGAKMAVCIASQTPPNNDWLITPPVVNPVQFKFWARSLTAQYGLERFKVGASTTGTAPANFTIVSGANYIQAPLEWTEYTYDVSTFDGTVYLGIQCVSDDAWFFMVDDVLVGGSDNEDPIVPVTVTTLKNNFPNPFNPETTIAFSTKEATPVTISIYNVKGQLVKTLVNEVKAAGDHNAVWNGTDNNGRPVSSGVYYYKMNAGKYSSTKKMIMMK